MTPKEEIIKISTEIAKAATGLVDEKSWIKNPTLRRMSNLFGVSTQTVVNEEIFRPWERRAILERIDENKQTRAEKEELNKAQERLQNLENKNYDKYRVFYTKINSLEEYLNGDGISQADLENAFKELERSPDKTARNALLTTLNIVNNKKEHEKKLASKVQRTSKDRKPMTAQKKNKTTKTLKNETKKTFEKATPYENIKQRIWQSTLNKDGSERAPRKILGLNIPKSGTSALAISGNIDNLKSLLSANAGQNYVFRRGGFFAAFNGQELLTKVDGLQKILNTQDIKINNKASDAPDYLKDVRKFEKIGFSDKKLMHQLVKDLAMEKLYGNNAKFEAQLKYLNSRLGNNASNFMLELCIQEGKRSTLYGNPKEMSDFQKARILEKWHDNPERITQETRNKNKLN